MTVVLENATKNGKGDKGNQNVKPTAAQNHRGEEAGRSMMVLANRIKPVAKEMLDLGRNVEHPILKVCSRALTSIVETPLTVKIEDVAYVKEKADPAALKVQAAVFPPNLVSSKNSLKNKLKTAVSTWEGAHRKMLNQNIFLRNRVVLLRSVIEFIEDYNSGDAKPLFELIDKYNASLAV